MSTTFRNEIFESVVFTNPYKVNDVMKQVNTNSRIQELLRTHSLIGEWYPQVADRDIGGYFTIRPERVVIQILEVRKERDVLKARFKFANTSFGKMMLDEYKESPSSFVLRVRGMMEGSGISAATSKVLYLITFDLYKPNRGAVDNVEAADTLTNIQVIQRSYEHWLDLVGRSDEDTEEERRLTFMTDEVMGLTTYSGTVSEHYGRLFLETIEVIRNRTTFDYCENDDGYRKYVIACHFLRDSIDWGTSIRGAWFDYTDGKIHPKFDLPVEGYDKDHIAIDEAFIDWLIKFLKVEDMESVS